MRIPGASAESEFSDTAERTATALALWKSERGFAAVVIIAGWLLKVRPSGCRRADAADLLCALPLLVRAAPPTRHLPSIAAVQTRLLAANCEPQTERGLSLLARAFILGGDDGGRDGADGCGHPNLGGGRDRDGAAELAGRACAIGSRRCTMYNSGRSV